LVEVIFCRMWNDNMKTPWIWYFRFIIVTVQPLCLSVWNLETRCIDNVTTILWKAYFCIYNLKLSRQLNSIKSSRAHSRFNWLQVETDVSGTISVPIIRVVMWLYTPSVPPIYLPGHSI
jgi:hypothetical protein